MISSDLNQAQGHLLDAITAMSELDIRKALDLNAAALDSLRKVSDAFDQVEILSIEAAINAAQAKVITLLEEEAIKAILP
jgi:aspartate carbamoyltransferase regulatory subunit